MERLLQQGLMQVFQLRDCMGQRHWNHHPALACAGFLLLLSLSGCLATRGWVQEQMAPVTGQVAEVETRLDQTEAKTTSVTQRMTEIDAHLGRTTTKADLALRNLEHLRLEQSFVLGIKEGVNFTPNSTSLTRAAQHAIDGFLQTLSGINDVIFLVAGHTDSRGSHDYNYALAQKRAASVARYLITQKGLDPLRVAVAAYGEGAPLANNASSQGRLKNRRVEIQVYKETVTSAPGPQRLEIERTRRR
jgi:outer membrane protein OmpA-like peptidoglycan-associated protein